MKVYYKSITDMIDAEIKKAESKGREIELIELTETEWVEFAAEHLKFTGCRKPTSGEQSRYWKGIQIQ